MKEIIQLITECKRKGVAISLDNNGSNIKAQGEISRLSALEKEFIKENKTAIIDFLQGIKSNEGYFRIPNAEKRPAYPVSSAQRRLWLISQNKVASIAYHVPLAFTFRGELHQASLIASFNTLMERHESLRTTFSEIDGNVCQVILEPADAKLELTCMDLRQDQDRASKINDLVREDFTKDFDLANGPLFRTALYQEANDKWVFTLVMHHIISDGWSMSVLIKELLSGYEAFRTSTIPSMPALKIQYRDYAVWQQENLQKITLNAHRSYWLNRFNDELPVLEFPTAVVRPAVKTYNGSQVTVLLPKALSSSIHQLCRDNGCTLFTALLAGVNALLYRYTSQCDIIIGSPVAGREHPDLNQQIGFYVNTIALRNRFDGADSYLELLRQVRVNILEAYQHQDFPFDQLVMDLPQARDMRRDPLFDVWMVLHNESETGPAGYQLKGLEIEKYTAVEHSSSRRDLTFSFIESEKEITLELGYNTDLYDKWLITQLANHFVSLMKCIVSHPNAPIQQLDYLSDSEKKEILVDLNATHSIVSDNSLFVERFINQALRTPDKTALICQEYSFTYRELDQCSNQLAHYLKSEYQIKMNDIVGIQLPRNSWAITSILGVLKSGAAYLPMEPAFPPDRVKYIREDSQCKLVIDEKELQRFKSKQDQRSNNAPAELPSGTNLAYVIYTSGSTGTPKGVMVSHAALIDYVNGVMNKTNLGQCRRFGLVSTIAADLGNTVIYTSLLTGGSLQVFSKDQAMDPKLMSTVALDAVKIVPSHWKALQASNLHFIPHKCLVFGGEKLTKDVIDQIKSIRIPEAIYNHYGPTETTIGKLCQKIDLNSESIHIPLGTPIGENQVYILDEQKSIVPKGVVGEIYIAGKGLGHGYVGKPELTRERFVRNPYAPGEQMYKTGDRGRILHDLTIEFMGRVDDQIKLRGYRIEPAEIENSVLQFEGVTNAVVTVADIQSERRLVAFFTSSRTVNTNDLQEFIRRRLPSYMIPAHYVHVDKILVTSNGKVDKKTLKIPASLGQPAKTSLVAADTETQRKLVSIWSEVLGIDPDKISIQDNFFDIGGHSLNAIKLVFKMNEHFNTDLELSILFEQATIEELSVEIENIVWLRDNESMKALNSTII